MTGYNRVCSDMYALFLLFPITCMYRYSDPAVADSFARALTVLVPGEIDRIRRQKLTFSLSTGWCKRFEAVLRLECLSISVL
jgi:hypothetical protein